MKAGVASQFGAGRSVPLFKLATPYLFILPWVIGFLAFTFGPLLFSLYTSFFDWPLIGEPKFIGLSNYRNMLFDDSEFVRSFWITLKFTALFVPTNMIVALLLALLLNQPMFASGVFRAVFYLPSIISGVALVTIWSWMFSHEYGVLNYMLSVLGIEPVNWLGSPKWALYSIVIVGLWAVGQPMLIFLAGLKSIQKDLYEAASLSGVGKIGQFLLITLPMLTPVILFNLVNTIITSFQQLTEAMLLTKGGPAKSTYLFAMYIYDTAFKHHDMGYASALSWFSFLLILLLTGIIFRSSSLWVFYEADVKRGQT
jgi:multiple sugar transport system permease protein